MSITFNYFIYGPYLIQAEIRQFTYELRRNILKVLDAFKK